MAMQATHVLFARDLAKFLEVKDQNAYYSGAIYPDTRYATKIDRNLTHGVPAPQDPFAIGLTDFERGWATHNLYDLEAGKELELILKKKTQGPEGWTGYTAAKIFEDRHSWKKLGKDAKIFASLKFDKPYRKESLEQLNSFTDMLRKLYIPEPTTEAYEYLCRGFGISEERMKLVEAAEERFTSEPAVGEQILAVYETVLQRVKPRK